MRSLNDPRRGSLPTVLLHLDQVQTGHPSPSAHQFRLPFNWLAPSELRRIFCSDEGDARDDCPIRHARRGGLVHVSGRVNGGTIDTGRPYCSAAVSESGDTVETKRAAHPFSAIRMRSLNDPHQGSLPTVQTVKPLSRCTTPASRCKPSHPSPSARQFRLLPNGLAISELRRMVSPKRAHPSSRDFLTRYISEISVK